ncbi:MAG: undecaprenyl-diphosphate phosphatase [Clostridiales bacterium]|nr:undecaprenyl-diphosphate phosphatase [Clostridiales bacterium]
MFLALFFLGFVQGLTEFLPVSSSGHLVLFSKVFGIEESLFVSIILHVATLLSVVVVLRKEVWHIIRHPFSKESMQLIMATIPTCIIALIFMPILKDSFNGVLLPLCFLISAILLMFSQRVKNGNKFDYKTALFMGIAQGFAIFPGLSRSGTTISAGLLSKGEREKVTKFSFIMSLPIIVLSLILELYEIFVVGESITIQFWPMIISFLTAFVTGVFAIKFMIKATAKANLTWFALYLVLIAIISLFIL